MLTHKSLMNLHFLHKQCETEIEQLNEEKKQLTIELRCCKGDLQETVSKIS